MIKNKIKKLEMGERFLILSHTYIMTGGDLLIDCHVKKLIEGAKNRDTAAFEQLIEPWRKTILYRCIRLTNTQDAEDVAQEALLNIFKSLPTLKDPEKFEPWLYAVVNRTCAHAVEKLKRDRTKTMLVNLEEYEELAGNEERREFLPHEYAEDKEKREILMRVIDELTPEYREALLLFYYDQKSYKEIGEIMEKSEQQVTNLLFRGKASIKKKLEKEANTEILFSTIPIGGISILTKALQADADSLITKQMCENLSAGLYKTISFGNVTPDASNTAVSPKSVTFKILVGIVAVSGLIAAGILAAGNREEVPATESLPSKTKAVENPTVSEEEPVSSEPPSSETVIITMVDMIGAEYETMLLSFETGEIDEASWQAFLDDIGANIEDEAYSPDGMEYRIYILQKQDKQLALFERKDTARGKLDVLHQFGNQADGIPYMTDVILLFDAI